MLGIEESAAKITYLKRLYICMHPLSHGFCVLFCPAESIESIDQQDSSRIGFEYFLRKYEESPRNWTKRSFVTIRSTFQIPHRLSDYQQGGELSVLSSFIRAAHCFAASGELYVDVKQRVQQVGKVKADMSINQKQNQSRVVCSADNGWLCYRQ